MFINSVKLYINLIEKIIELVQGKRRKHRALNTPLGETLRKVESAQEHLTDALEAIDVIREQVVAEKTQLDSLLTEVAHKRDQYDQATNDLELTQELLSKDHDKLRDAIGVNSSRAQIVGFVGGVVASIIATALWVIGTKVWSWWVALSEANA